MSLTEWIIIIKMEIKIIVSSPIFLTNSASNFQIVLKSWPVAKVQSEELFLNISMRNKAMITPKFIQKKKWCMLYEASFTIPYTHHASPFVLPTSDDARITKNIFSKSNVLFCPFFLNI